MSVRSLLWAAKQPVETSTGGDEIYNTNNIKEFSKEFDISIFNIKRQGLLKGIANLASGLPHPRFKYYSKQLISDFRKAASEADAIVVSWESFDFLPLKIEKPVTLIIHNVMSDTINQIFKGNALARVAALQSVRWERKVYNKPLLRLVVLSERDRQLVQALAPRSRVVIAPPGCPSPVDLVADRFIPEVVISGSFDWAPKRRDFTVIARQYDLSDLSLKFRHDLALPSLTPPSSLTSLSEKISRVEFADGLRIGLIPDTFLGGFKLKSTFYIAMNCIVASMSDIRSEFDGLPHAGEFVRIVKNLDDVKELADSFYHNQDKRIFQRWHEFKSACLRRFSWQRSAEVIASTLSQN